MMLTTSSTLLLQHREKFLAFKCDQCDFATALTGGLTRHKIALHYNLREVRIALRRLTQEDIDSFEKKEVVNDDFNHEVIQEANNEVSHEVIQEVSHEASNEVIQEVNTEINQPANMEGDKFEFINLPPVEVKEEQVSVNECRMCGFTAPPMQTILLVRHMREVHGEVAGTSADAKRRKLAGEDPLSHS